MRHFKESIFYGPLSNWRVTAIPQVINTTTTKSPNYRRHSLQRLPTLLENQGNLKCLLPLKLSCVCTSTQLSQLSRILNTCTRTDFRPTLLRISTVTYSSASVNWRSRFEVYKIVSFWSPIVSFLYCTISVEEMQPQAQKLTTDSPAHPWKTQVNIPPDPKAPWRQIWLLKLLGPVAEKLVLQPWAVFPSICLPTQQHVKTIKRFSESH